MPANNKTYAVFYEHPQLQGDGTHKDVVLAEIFIMGNQNTSTSKPVYDADGEPILYQGETLIDRYPNAWKKFSNDQGYELDGEPLKNLGMIGPGQIRNLNSMGIDTIEDLAGLDDSVVIGERGMLDMRNRARAYMDALHPEQAKAREDALESQLEELKKKMEMMQADLEEAKKPKRGRPKST